MKGIRTSIVAVSIACLSISCDQGKDTEKIIYQSEPVEINVSYTNPEYQRMLKKALKNAHIPYAIVQGKDGKEYVQWDRKDANAVQKVKDQLFGVAPPPGRSIAFEGEMNQRFKDWLAKNKIDYTTTTHFGTEYVIWAQEDSPRVEGFGYFPSYYFDMEGKSSNNSLKSGTRENPRAP
jgi:hypothetical protein